MFLLPLLAGCGGDGKRFHARSYEQQQQGSAQPEAVYVLRDESRSNKGYITNKSDYLDLLSDIRLSSKKAGVPHKLFRYGIDVDKGNVLEEVQVADEMDYLRDPAKMRYIGNEFSAIFRQTDSLLTRHPKTVVLILTDGIVSPQKLGATGIDATLHKMKNSLVQLANRSDLALDLYAFTSHFRGAYYLDPRREVAVDTARNFYLMAFYRQPYRAFVREKLGLEDRSHIARRYYRDSVRVKFRPTNPSDRISREEPDVELELTYPSGTLDSTQLQKFAHTWSENVNYKPEFVINSIQPGDEGMHTVNAHLKLIYDRINPKENTVRLGVKIRPGESSWQPPDFRKLCYPQDIQRQNFTESKGAIDHSKTLRLPYLLRSLEDVYSEAPLGGITVEFRPS